MKKGLGEAGSRKEVSLMVFCAMLTPRPTPHPPNPNTLEQDSKGMTSPRRLAIGFKGEIAERDKIIPGWGS